MKRYLCAALVVLCGSLFSVAQATAVHVTEKSTECPCHKHKSCNCHHHHKHHDCHCKK